MTRSKKIFAGIALLFFLLLAYVVYDISSRTTFPGSKPGTQESPGPENDSIPADTTKP